jgi:toxin FitB
VSTIVLDTDVASASLRNRLPDQLRARLAGQTMAVTFVTVGELAKWRALRDCGPRRIAGLARWRERVAVLQYDEARSSKPWKPTSAPGSRTGTRIPARSPGSRPPRKSWIL